MLPRGLIEWIISINLCGLSGRFSSSSQTIKEYFDFFIHITQIIVERKFEQRYECERYF